eukprot:CAMPEP_0170647542 /NCGR_PEP_ID=MMETSP0224-20130122/44242_1 /TAXON_ID=285029 /ORGANISM="Togula jolla, Strain CCCM 725" /LENGTH=238 /DNA_ID=CAMNT_0010978979 /DNA_START=88 /DNA_END=804 /DNA_ORIENTATION=-
MSVALTSLPDEKSSASSDVEPTGLLSAEGELAGISHAQELDLLGESKALLQQEVPDPKDPLSICSDHWTIVVRPIHEQLDGRIMCYLDILAAGLFTETPLHENSCPFVGALGFQDPGHEDDSSRYSGTTTGALRARPTRERPANQSRLIRASRLCSRGEFESGSGGEPGAGILGALAASTSCTVKADRRPALKSMGMSMGTRSTCVSSGSAHTHTALSSEPAENAKRRSAIRSATPPS